jgi:hypothetical protein
MARARLIGTSMIALALGGAALAQPAGRVGASPPPPLEPDPEEISPWPVRIGERALAIDLAVPIIDRVVLVPLGDAAAYVHEISRWSSKGRWPVLFQDEHFAPMFIRRFQPAEVIVRDANGTDGVRPLPSAASDRRVLLQSIVARVWGSAEGLGPGPTLREVFARRNHKPPGAVIAWEDDPAWTAALALAAGRGQPLLWLGGQLGRPNGAVSAEAAADLAARIADLLDESGYSWRGLGDEIDAVAICRNLPGRVNAHRFETGKEEPLAITDFLGRVEDERRAAFVGWIFGDEVRSAYMAMCSLFLPRVNVTLVNTYPSGGEWEAFSISGATAVLAEHGCEVRDHPAARAGDAAWFDLIMGGLAADVFIMNTKGNVNFFDLPQSRMSTLDVPLPSTPVAVHFTHSWSLRQPESEETIGGRWLAGGAYAYVGSVHEPYLGAFVPPLPLAARCIMNVPFLIAARHWERGPGHPFGGPWKVNTIGDPLMLFAPMSHAARERVQRPAEYGTNLVERVRMLMRDAADESASSPTFAEAIAMLNLLGRDDLAVQVWRLAEQRGAVDGFVARAALGPLFRTRDVAAFMRAWEHATAPSEREMDMLWHLSMPRVRSGRVDEGLLLALMGAVRPALPHIDVERLAPLADATLGPGHGRRLIERELERGHGEAAQRRLRDLLSRQ